MVMRLMGIQKRVKWSRARVVFDQMEGMCTHIWMYSYVWQSHVGIKDNSVTYFNCIAAIKVLYCWTSIKGGFHRCVNTIWVYEAHEPHPKWKFSIRHLNNLHFYTRLPHMNNYECKAYCLVDSSTTLLYLAFPLPHMPVCVEMSVIEWSFLP